MKSWTNFEHKFAMLHYHTGRRFTA